MRKSASLVSDQRCLTHFPVLRAPRTTTGQTFQELGLLASLSLISLGLSILFWMQFDQGNERRIVIHPINIQ